MIDAPAHAVPAQTRNIHQPQVTGAALPQEALLQLAQDIIRQLKADKSIHRYGFAVPDQGCGLGSGNLPCHGATPLIPR